MSSNARSRESLPSTPSQLADSLANIRLNDVVDGEVEESKTTATQQSIPPSPQRASPSSVAETLQHIAHGLDAIRAHFFTIQEKRHAGVFALVDQPRLGAEELADTPSKKDGRVSTEKSVALDVEMARLNALMEDVSEKMQSAELQLEPLSTTQTDPPTLTKRGSMSSLSSLESFDDAFGGLDSIGLLKKPEALKRQHSELVTAWEAVQREAKSLEKELSGDKYLLVFNSFGDQIEEMMDSLDKALASCHDFVFTFNRDRAQQMMGVREPSSPDTSRSGDQLTSWRSTEDRLASLQSVKRSFNVKRASYGPACEQLFVALAKGVKQHAPSNGTILRRFAELKTRWRNLRERVARMDKELKRIEVQLVDLDVNEGKQAAASFTPERTSRADLDRPTRRRTPDAVNHSPSSSLPLSPDSSAVDLASSPSSTNRSINVSPRVAHRGTPPVKPVKSVNRMSMLDPQRQTTALSSHPTEHARSASVASAPRYAHLGSPGIQARTSSLAYAVDEGLNATSSPPISYPHQAVLRKERLLGSDAVNFGSDSSSQSPVHPLRRTNAPSSSRSPLLASGMPRYVPSNAETSTEIHLMEDEETLMDLTERFNPSSPTFERPSSAAGSSKGSQPLRGSETRSERPPSSTGHVARPSSSASQFAEEKRSRIPRLVSSMRRPSSEFGANGDDRPGSALSFTSTLTTTRTNVGQSPKSTMHRGGESSSTQSARRRQERDAALRSSMQTPEPTIMARVQRMSLFGGGGQTNNGKRTSRPPPTRYSSTFYASGHNASSSSLGSTLSAGQSPTSRPTNVSKRQSGLWSGLNGRTTPLSAAALAKVPQGTVEIGEGSGRASKARSVTQGADGRTFSAGNRASVVHSYAPSATSGRATPTFSDGGTSSVWGAGTGVRPSSRMQGSVVNGFARSSSYRPNVNDAIDVEVARVVNSLGVRIERVDPPLPRGVREMNPSNSTLVRYQIGDKVIVCKLLQLHRPGNHQAGADDANKAKKVLTRVGGGWIDLEQYLLSRLGAM